MDNAARKKICYKRRIFNVFVFIETENDKKEQSVERRKKNGFQS